MTEHSTTCSSVVYAMQFIFTRETRAPSSHIGLHVHARYFVTVLTYAVKHWNRLALQALQQSQLTMMTMMTKY